MGVRTRKSSIVSLTDVAEAAGVSKVAASFALRNKPGVSEATRERVVQIAKQLGYAPDPRISTWMAQSRDTRGKGLLPIAWFNNHTCDPDAWRKYSYLSPYLEGARERCAVHGYRIEEIWSHQPDMTAKRLLEIIYRRGIEGAVITHLARRFRLNWQYLAGVTLEGPFHSPRLPQIMTDHLYNLQLAIKVARRMGYRRIGVCLEDTVDRQTDHALRGALQYYNAQIPLPERVPPIFHVWGSPAMVNTGTADVISWWKRERPEAVIGHSSLLVDWANMAGFRVPEEVGVAHLATDDDVTDWAGICSNKREIGATAIDLLITRMQKRQFGIPKVAPRTLIRGRWQLGRTMINWNAGLMSLNIK